jgi:hypothetical protein
MNVTAGASFQSNYDQNIPAWVLCSVAAIVDGTVMVRWLVLIRFNRRSILFYGTCGSLVLQTTAMIASAVQYAYRADTLTNAPWAANLNNVTHTVYRVTLLLSELLLLWMSIGRVKLFQSVLEYRQRTFAMMYGLTIFVHVAASGLYASYLAPTLYTTIMDPVWTTFVVIFDICLTVVTLRKVDDVNRQALEAAARNSLTPSNNFRLSTRRLHCLVYVQVVLLIAGLSFYAVSIRVNLPMWIGLELLFKSCYYVLTAEFFDQLRLVMRSNSDQEYYVTDDTNAKSDMP